MAPAGVGEGLVLVQPGGASWPAPPAQEAVAGPTLQWATLQPCAPPHARLPAYCKALLSARARAQGGGGGAAAALLGHNASGCRRGAAHLPEPRRGWVVQGQGGRWPGFLLGFLTGPPSPLRREMALPPADKVSTAVSAGPMWQPMRGGSVGVGAAALKLQRYHIHLLFTHATRQHIHATGLQLAPRESLYICYCPSPSFATQKAGCPTAAAASGLGVPSTSVDISPTRQGPGAWNCALSTCACRLGSCTVTTSPASPSSCSVKGGRSWPAARGGQGRGSIMNSAKGSVTAPGGRSSRPIEAVPAVESATSLPLEAPKRQFTPQPRPAHLARCQRCPAPVC